MPQGRKRRGANTSASTVARQPEPQVFIRSFHTALPAIRAVIAGADLHPTSSELSDVDQAVTSEADGVRMRTDAVRLEICFRLELANDEHDLVELLRKCCGTGSFGG